METRLPETIRALWIDVDNTLLDFYRCADDCSARCFSDWHLEWKPEYSAVFHEINNGLWKQIEEGTLDLEGLKQVRWNRILERLGIQGVDGVAMEVRFRQYLNESHVPVEGALEALEQLGRHFALFVISNGPSRQQKNRLQKAGMLECFEQVFTSQEFGVLKPDPLFFEQAWQESRRRIPDLVKDEILVIGDSWQADITGGRQAGFPVCWFLLPQSGMHAETADVPVVHSWNQLLDMLQPVLTGKNEPEAD